MVRLDEGGRAAGEALLLPPRPALRAWVQHISIQPGPARHRQRPWRVVPDTAGHVIVSVLQDGRVRGRVVGARSTYADIDVDGRLCTVALRLVPGALPALVRGAAAALTDRAIEIDDALGAAARRRLADADAGDPLAIVHALQDVVEARVANADAPVRETVLAGVGRVEQLQAALGLRARALHARMLATVGLAPKRALRIERLHAALAEANRGASNAGVAVAAGYSDQAHFTREARRLLGEPPAVWRRRGADSFKNGR